MAEPAWVEIARGVAAGAQVLAIAIGGWWAFLRFGHGRTIVPRAEVRVSGELLQNADAVGLAVEAAMHNTGAAKIDLFTKVVYLYGAEPAFWPDDSPLDWDKRLTAEREVDPRPESGAIRSVEVFSRHTRLEPNETISDSLLIPVPQRLLVGDHEWLAYRVELVVNGDPKSRLFRPNRTPRKVGKTVKPWRATCVVPGSLVKPEKEAKNAVAD